MTSDFSITIDGWIGSDFGPREERETIAELGLVLGNTWLTEVEEIRSSSVRKTVRVSAYLLAKWLLNGWWRLQWEPELVTRDESVDWHLTHDLAAIGNGFVWPPYSIVGEGDYSVVRSIDRPASAATMLAPIRYLNRIPVTHIKRSKYEAVVDGFVNTVIERLHSRGMRDTDLHELTSLVRGERRDDAARNIRRREALLGFDPDEAPPDLFEFLDEKGEQIGREAADEIAAASLVRSQRDDLGTLFNALDETVAQAVRLDASAAIRKSTFDLTTVQRRLIIKSKNWVDRPAVHGIIAARGLRRKLGLRNEPADNGFLRSALGIPDRVFVGLDVPVPPLSIGSREANGELAIALAPRSRHGRRFELARVLGDDLFYEEADRWRPATQARTQRQQFQRAFAAEFLCPVLGLRERLDARRPRETLLDDLAQEFDVSTQVVEWQIRNNARLLPLGTRSHDWPRR